MFNLVSHLVRSAGLALSRRMQSNSDPSSAGHCAVCGRPASLTTNCCGTYLCDAHAAAWKHSAEPCPCHSR